MSAAMTRPDVERALVAIASDALTDPESATSRERRLIRDVLLTIAGDATTSGDLARCCLRAWELEFNRGYGGGR